MEQKPTNVEKGIGRAEESFFAKQNAILVIILVREWKKTQKSETKHVFSNDIISLHINHYLKNDFDGKNPTNFEKGSGRAEEDDDELKKCVFSEDPCARMQNTQTREKKPFVFQ